MGRTINMTVKKKDQISHGWLGLYSHGFIKFYFRALPVSKHGERRRDWSKAGSFGKCVSTPTPQRVQFLCHVSPMQGKQRLTEAGKWESDNGNKRRAWLLAKRRHARWFSMRGPSSSPGHFHDLFTFQAYGICQFIGMALKSLTALNGNL